MAEPVKFQVCRRCGKRPASPFARTGLCSKCMASLRHPSHMSSVRTLLDDLDLDPTTDEGEA